MSANPPPRLDAANAGDIEVVLFDLGGVVIELGGLGDMAVFAGERDEDEIWRRWLGCPWVRRFERGGCDAESFARGMVESWSMPVGPDEFIEAFAVWPRGLIAGAKALLRETRARRPIAALSNTNALHNDRFQAEFRLHEDFDALYLSHEIGHVKPDRAAFDHATVALGVAPERILFLDDNQINVDGAREAGLRAERAVGVKGARAVLTRLGLI